MKFDKIIGLVLMVLLVASTVNAACITPLAEETYTKQIEDAGQVATPAKVFAYWYYNEHKTEFDDIGYSREESLKLLEGVYEAESGVVEGEEARVPEVAPEAIPETETIPASQLQTTERISDLPVEDYTITSEQNVPVILGSEDSRWTGRSVDDLVVFTEQTRDIEVAVNRGDNEELLDRFRNSVRGSRERETLGATDIDSVKFLGTKADGVTTVVLLQKDNKRYYIETSPTETVVRTPEVVEGRQRLVQVDEATKQEITNDVDRYATAGRKILYSQNAFVAKEATELPQVTIKISRDQEFDARVKDLPAPIRIMTSIVAPVAKMLIPESDLLRQVPITDARLPGAVYTPAATGRQEAITTAIETDSMLNYVYTKFGIAVDESRRVYLLNEFYQEIRRRADAGALYLPQIRTIFAPETWDIDKRILAHEMAHHIWTGLTQQQRQEWIDFVRDNHPGYLEQLAADPIHKQYDINTRQGLEKLADEAFAYIFDAIFSGERPIIRTDISESDMDMYIKFGLMTEQHKQESILRRTQHLTETRTLQQIRFWDDLVFGENIDPVLFESETGISLLEANSLPIMERLSKLEQYFEKLDDEEVYVKLYSGSPLLRFVEQQGYSLEQYNNLPLYRRRGVKQAALEMMRAPPAPETLEEYEATEPALTTRQEIAEPQATSLLELVEKSETELGLSARSELSDLAITELGITSASEIGVVNDILLELSGDEAVKFMNLVNTNDDVRTAFILYVDHVSRSPLRVDVKWHNLAHAAEHVIEGVELLKSKGVSEQVQTSYMVAALLHDTGYYVENEYGTIQTGHEDDSIRFVTSNAERLGLSENDLEDIVFMIEGTKFATQPDAFTGRGSDVVYAAKILAALDVLPTTKNALARVKFLQEEFVRDKQVLTQAGETELAARIFASPSGIEQVAGSSGFWAFVAKPRVEALGVFEDIMAVPGIKQDYDNSVEVAGRLNALLTKVKGSETVEPQRLTSDELNELRQIGEDIDTDVQPIIDIHNSIPVRAGELVERGARVLAESPELIAAGEGEVAVPSEGVGYEEVFEPLALEIKSFKEEFSDKVQEAIESGGQAALSELITNLEEEIEHPTTVGRTLAAPVEELKKIREHVPEKEQERIDKIIDKNPHDEEFSEYIGTINAPFKARGFISHCHTKTFSDGAFSVDEVIEKAVIGQFSVLSITDHNSIGAYELQGEEGDEYRLLGGTERYYYKEIDGHIYTLADGQFIDTGIMLQPGVEMAPSMAHLIPDEGYHMLFYFKDIKSLKEFYKENFRLDELSFLDYHYLENDGLTMLRSAKKYGGATILAHPDWLGGYMLKRYSQDPQVKQILEEIDGFEIINGGNLFEWMNSKSFGEINDAAPGKVLISGADMHYGEFTAYSNFHSEQDLNKDNLFQAIKSKDPEGKNLIVPRGKVSTLSDKLQEVISMSDYINRQWRRNLRRLISIYGSTQNIGIRSIYKTIRSLFRKTDTIEDVREVSIEGNVGTYLIQGREYSVVFSEAPYFSGTRVRKIARVIRNIRQNIDPEKAASNYGMEFFPVLELAEPTILDKTELTSEDILDLLKIDYFNVLGDEEKGRYVRLIIDSFNKKSEELANAKAVFKEASSLLELKLKPRFKYSYSRQLGEASALSKYLSEDRVNLVIALMRIGETKDSLEFIRGLFIDEGLIFSSYKNHILFRDVVNALPENDPYIDYDLLKKALPEGFVRDEEVIEDSTTVVTKRWMEILEEKSKGIREEVVDVTPVTETLRSNVVYVASNLMGQEPIVIEIASRWRAGMIDDLEAALSESGVEEPAKVAEEVRFALTSGTVAARVSADGHINPGVVASMIGDPVTSIDAEDEFVAEWKPKLLEAMVWETEGNLLGFASEDVKATYQDELADAETRRLFRQGWSGKKNEWLWFLKPRPRGEFLSRYDKVRGDILEAGEKAAAGFDTLLNTLIYDLDNSNRIKAAEELAKVGDASVGGVLIKEAQDSRNSPGIRASILRTIAQIGQRDVFDDEVSIGLRNIARSPYNLNIYNLAINALGVMKYGDFFEKGTSVEFLISELRVHEYEKNPIIWALGDLGDERALPALERLASEGKANRFTNEQTAAVDAIAKIGGNRALYFLFETWAGGDFDAKQHARWAIWAYGDQVVDRVIEKLNDKEYLGRANYLEEELIDALGKIEYENEDRKRKAASKLVDLLERDDVNHETINTALNALGEGVVDILIDNLKSPKFDSSIKRNRILQAILQIGEIKTTQEIVIPTMVDAFKEKELRNRAGLILAKIGMPAYEPVKEMITQDADQDKIEKTVLTLSMIDAMNAKEEGTVNSIFFGDREEPLQKWILYKLLLQHGLGDRKRVYREEAYKLYYDELGGREDDLERELGTILELFETPSLKRDDMLLDLIDRKASKLEQANRIASFLSKNSGGVDELDMFPVDEQDIISEVPVSVFAREIVRAYNREKRIELLKLLIGISDKFDTGVYETIEIGGRPRVGYSTYKIKDKDEAAKFRNSIFSASETEFNSFIEFLMKGNGGVFDPITVADQKQMDDFLNEVFNFFVPETEVTGITRERISIAFHTIFQTYSPDRRTAIFITLLNLKEKLKDASMGEKYKLFLSSLGAAGVKAGQFLSEQEGIIESAELRDSLGQLKEAVKPFSKQEAFEVINTNRLENEVAALGTRLGSGSIKQVHLATLEDGSEVAIKIKRPGLDDLLDEDFKVLVTVVNELKKTGMEIPDIVDFVREGIEKESDFRNEVEAAALIGNLGYKSPEEKHYNVKFAKILESNKDMIVEEAVKGVSFSLLMQMMEHKEDILLEDAELKREVMSNLGFEESQIDTILSLDKSDIEKLLSFDVNEISDILLDHIFYQIFDAGLFHGDPHGGNFMITPNGEIYIIDLGDIGKLEANERRALSGVVIGISRQDVEYTLLNVDKILGSRQSEEIKNSITYIINSDKPVIEKMKDLWITVSNKAKGPGKDSFNSAMKTLAKVDYLIRLSGKDEKFFRRHGVGLANYYDLTAAKVKQYFGMVESAPELEDVKEELTGEEGEKEKGEVEDKVISLLEKGYMVAGITGRGVNRKNPMYEESEKGILEIGEAAVPYLLRYLESEQVHSPYIASTLAKIGGESVLELMKQRVNSELYHVSNAAIEVIGKIGSEEEFPILRDALLDGGWRYETGTVIDAMENMDDKRTFGVVIEFLVSDHARYMTSPVLKSKIRNLLLKMGDEELSEMQATYDGLEPVKPDDVEYVKNRIRMIIGHDYYSELAQEEYFSKIYFTPRGEHAGRDLIQDVIETLTKRNEVKQKILEALKASEGSAEIIEEIDKLRTYQEEVYSEGKGALLKYGTEIVPALLEASEYDDMNKEVLFGLLGDIGDSRALPLLIRNLDNARYRGIVAQALSKIGDEQAIKPMVDYLVKNMFYLRELRRPIISFGDKSLPYLKEAISDKKVDEHHVNDIEKMIDEIESMAPEERLQERGESQEALTSLASRILIVMAEELERYVEGGDVGGLTPIQQEFLDELLEQGKITQNEYKQALETGQMPFIAAGEGEVAVPGEGVGYEEVGLVGVEELPEAQRTEIEYHLDTLKYGDLDSRLRASQKLWEIGEGSVPFIISALNEESIPKSIGVRILGFIGGARARDVIVRYISDPNYNVRAEVAGALGRIKDPDSIEILIGLRNDDSDYVRIVAGNALGEIGAPALERLHQLMGESESDVRFALVPLRFISDDSSIPYLVESYKYENTDIRNEIREFFILGSEKRINTLVSYLEVDKLTPYALELVEDFGKKEAVEPLIRLLGHQDSEVRLKAAKILVESQDPRVIEPLSEAFNEPAIAEGLALRFVTRIVSEDDFMRFSSEFESRPEKTRVALLKAFSDAYIFQKRLALNFLQKQYESENENIRAAAITGLTKLDKEGETLLRGLSDKSTKVRAASLEAYIEANQYDIEDRHIDLLVDHLRGKGVEVGEVAVRWLATLSKYDILKNQFKGDELDNEIALVLLENGDDNYRSYVDQLLKDSNRRKRTIDVIGKLNLIEHAPQLFGLLDTEESSLSIDALTNMDGEPILEKVVQLLDHKEPKVRRFAAEKILEQSSYLKDVVSNGEELINTVQKMHNEGLQLRDTVELVERLALVSPEMFTPAVMDDLSSIYGDRLRYARFFVSGRKEGLEILETEVQREFKSRVLEGKKEIVIVHNFQDGIGDELIRVTTLVESLLDANPELKIKIFTARPYLYDSHERLEVDSLFGLLGEQTSGYDMVINFEGPPNQRTNQWSNIASRIISNSIDTVVLQNQGSHDIHMLMGGLEVDLEFSGNVYLTSYRFLAEMGVPFKIEEESRNSIIVNKEGEFTEQWWKDNELENKKVVALNLFGGTIKEKGITNREEFREIVNDLIKQGYHVLVLPNHQEWGTVEEAMRMVEGIDKGLTVVEVVPGDQPTFLKNVVSKSDLVVTVEGGLMHLAYLLGKKHIALEAEKSGSFRYWKSVGSSEDQAHVGRGSDFETTLSSLEEPGLTPENLAYAQRNLQEMESDVQEIAARWWGTEKNYEVLRQMLVKAGKDPGLATEISFAMMGGMPDAEVARETVFFEENPLATTLYEEVLGYEQQGIVPYEISERLEARFTELDEKTYDCHSFAWGFMNSIGVPAPATLEVEKPNLEDFEDETDYLVELRNRLQLMRETAAGQVSVKEQQRFTEGIYKNSVQIPIKQHSVDEYLLAQQEGVNKVREVIAELKRGFSSRLILISNNEPGNDFYDAHSTVVLGETQDGNDLWVIEKAQVGAPIRVKRLSKVIEDWSLGRYQNLNINILKRRVEDIVEVGPAVPAEGVEHITIYQLKAADETTTLEEWGENLYNFWVPRSLDIKTMYEQAKAVSTNDEPVIVSIGSGTAITEYLLAKRGAEVYAVDPDLGQIQAAAEKYDLVPHPDIQNVWIPRKGGKNDGLKLTLIKGDHVTFKEQINSLGVNTIQYPQEIIDLQEEVHRLRRQFISEMRPLQNELYKLNNDLPDYLEREEQLYSKMKVVMDDVYKPMMNSLFRLYVRINEFHYEIGHENIEKTGKYIDGLFGSWMPRGLDFRLYEHGAKLIFYSVPLNTESSGIPSFGFITEIKGSDGSSIEYMRLDDLEKGVFSGSYEDLPTYREIDIWNSIPYGKLPNALQDERLVSSNNIKVKARSDVKRKQDREKNVPMFEDVKIYDDELYGWDREMIEQDIFFDEDKVIPRPVPEPSAVSKLLSALNPFNIPKHIKTFRLGSAAETISNYNQEKSKLQKELRDIEIWFNEDVAKLSKDDLGYDLHVDYLREDYQRESTPYKRRLSELEWDFKNSIKALERYGEVKLEQSALERVSKLYYDGLITQQEYEDALYKGQIPFVAAGELEEGIEPVEGFGYEEVFEEEVTKPITKEDFDQMPRKMEFSFTEAGLTASFKFKDQDASISLTFNEEEWGKVKDRDLSLFYVDEETRTLVYPGPVELAPKEEAPYYIDNLAPRELTVDKSKIQRMSAVDVGSLLRDLAGDEIILYTGAGISMAGEEPVWGMNQFKNALGLLDGSFIEAFTSQDKTSLDRILSNLHEFRRQLFTDVTTDAHKAITQIVKQRPGTLVMTENIDLKHEAEGSRLDALHLDNPEERGFDVIKARKVPKVLITVGLSLDDRAVIQYLKQKNPDMKIVSFTRSSVPAFLDETDAVVLGDAQETLPEVAEELSAIPRAVLDELAARPVEELSFKDMSAFFKKYFGQLKYKAVTSDAEFTLEGLFKAPARVQEGYSIEEHTERVFNNLESQLASIDKGKEIPLEDPINLYTFMRVIMTLHDIGKPLALTTAKQHKETPIIMNDLMSRLGFKESQINLAIELVTSNVLGYVLREVPFTANDGFHEIKESSQKTGLDIQTYFDMLKIVYISDAGSYPSLIHLFEERDGRLYIDSRFTEVTRLERMISGELVPKKRDTFLYTLEGEDVRVKFLEGIPATKEEGDERVLAAFQFYLQNSEDPSILDEIEQRFGLKPLFESPRPEEVEAAAIITEERFTLTFAQRKILKDSLEYMVITQEVYDEALRTNTMPEDRAYVEKVLYWLDPEHIEITAKWWSVGKGDVSILEDMLRRAGEEGAASIAWIIDSGLATVTPEMKARIDSLIEQLTGDDSDIAESKLALDIGNPAVPALIEALKSSNAKLREGAAGTFTRGFNHPKIAPALIEALKVETDQGIKYTILEALKANPHPDAIPILIQNYDFDRKATARALEAIGGEEVIEYVSTINEVPAAEKSEILSANKETLDVLANFERPLAGEERDFLYHTTDLLLMPQIYSSGGLKGQKVGERDAFMDEMLLKVRPDLADRGFSRTYALYAHLDKTLSGIDTMPDIVLRIKVPEESVIVADAENVVRSGTLQLSIDKATLYWEGAKDLKTYRQELEAGEVSVERMEALIKDPVPNEQIQIYQYPADIQVLFKKLGVKSATEALALEGITPSQKQFLDELLEKGQITREEYDEAIRTGKMPFVASAEGELAVPSEGFGYEEVFEEAPDLEQIVQTSFEQQVKQQRVSIVIPAYKETEQTLGRLLNRLAEQQISDDEAFNKDNLEVIVSIGTEGPDTDTSIKVVEDFIRNNPGMNVKVEINMPLGPGGQRNSGARLASNDLLLFLDSDVDIEKDFLWKGIFEMKNKDLQVAGTYAELKDPEFDILDKAFWGMTNTAMRASQYVNPQALGQTIFVDKELYEQVGGFDETVKFAEDARFVNAAAKTAGIGSFRMLEDTTTGLNRRRFTEDRGMLYLRLIGATIKNTFGGKVKAAWYPFGEYEDTSTSVEIIEPEALPEQTEAPITDFTGFTEELRREKPTLVDIVQKIATEQEKISAKESFIANVQGRDVNTNERPISPMYGILNRANAAEVFSRDLGEKIAPGMYGGKAVIYRDDLGKLNIAFMTETKSTHHRHALATLVGLENPGSQRFYDGDLDSPESASLLQRSAGFEFLYDANKGEIIDIRQDSWITKRQIERGIQVSDIENFVLTLFENIDEDLLSEDFKDANWLDNPELSQHILLYAST